MKKVNRFTKAKWRTLCAAVAMSACFGSFTSCSKYDLDEYVPAGWGSSIYSYLKEQGNYNNTLQLIDDLRYAEVLGKTGSKTLFVADDDAYERFYKSNPWNVKKYSDLTPAQKKMLLLGNMINSSYQVHDLASIEGPIEGQCIRRISSQTVFDTVSVVKPEALPNMDPKDWKNNSLWKKFAGRQSVTLMRDMTETPMIYFVEAALRNNKISNDDYNFLFNYKNDRQDGDASVNGVKIEQQNIKCSNGFIHKMADVIVPLQNMAEIIASTPEASQYNKLLERFSLPVYVGKEATEQYRFLTNTTVDSVFEKRFLAEKSQGTKLAIDDDNVTHQDLLRYDPEWNTFYSNPIPNASVAVEKDMALMLVPTDEALDKYWNYGEGQVLKDQYETWDNVPNNVIVELLNNNMLYSFISSVPSKFDNLLNDANDPMGLTKDAVEKVAIGCNGGIYFTNKVFPPTSFVSVLYPAIVNESMRIMRWAVEKNNYKVYLNSLNSKFSFFIPTNDAFLTYIDPVSYGSSQTYLYKFHYDESMSCPVWASRFYYDMNKKTIGDSIDEIRNNEFVMKSKLKEVLDNHIVIGDVEDGHTYYRTKGGQEIMVENVAGGAGKMKVYGSLALNDGMEAQTVSYIYDQTSLGNGKAYILDKSPIMTTRKSVLDIIKEHEEMSEFRKLLEGSSLIESIHKQGQDYVCLSDNIGVFNTYHYTVYVPTNESILALIKSGELPQWDDVANAQVAGDTEREEALTKKIEDFLRLHIQDYALYIGAKEEKEEGYETALINDKTGKFERLYATLDSDNITIRNTQDKSSSKLIEAHVKKTPGKYNLMAREYILDGTKIDITDQGLRLYTSSTAVVHLIDKALKLAK